MYKEDGDRLIGERLSELRLDMGLTQQELADKLCISVHTVSSYERNMSNPDDEMKIKIAKLFNVSMDYLLGITKNQCSISHPKSRVLVVENLPDVAIKELDKFLVYLRNKYSV